jgi:hypothetical protein
VSDWLSVAANISDVVTATIAGAAYLRFVYFRRKRKAVLEEYLRNEQPGKRSAGDKGRRTLRHLSAELCMREDDILDIAFESSNIRCSTDHDHRNRTDMIYLEHVTNRRDAVRPAPSPDHDKPTDETRR